MNKNLQPAWVYLKKQAIEEFDASQKENIVLSHNTKDWRPNNVVDPISKSTQYYVRPFYKFISKTILIHEK